MRVFIRASVTTSDAMMSCERGRKERSARGEERKGERRGRGRGEGGGEEREGGEGSKGRSEGRMRGEEWERVKKYKTYTCIH